MILTTHALVGAAIGKNIENPYFVILLSLMIHFFLDSFRHGEYFDSRVATIKDTAWKILLDLFIPASIILFFILSTHSNFSLTRNILLGAFFSILPDFFTVLLWTFHWKILKKIKEFHSFCHYYWRFPKFSPERQWTLRNALNDILFSTIAIIILFL